MTVEPPIDVNAVAADEQLIEDLRAGNTPDGRLNTMLAALRDDAAGNTPAT